MRVMIRGEGLLCPFAYYLLFNMLSLSTCFFLIALRLYSYLLHFSTCLQVYPFSMQVIDQDVPRQGIIGLGLSGGVGCVRV